MPRHAFVATRVLAVVALLACAVLAPVSVRAGDNEDGVWLLGSWVAHSGDQTLRLTFEQDGKVRFTAKGAEGEESETGTWSLAGGRLRLIGAAGDVNVYAFKREAGEADSFTGTDVETGKNAITYTRDGVTSAPTPASPAAPENPAAPEKPDAPAPTTPAARPVVYHGPLVGRWVHTDAFQIVTLTFVPDGRYAWGTKIGDNALNETGTFTATDDTLSLAPIGGSPSTLSITLGDGTLAVTGGGLGTATLEFAKVKGSERAVVEETAAADAAKAVEDDAWRTRFPVGPRPDDATHVAVGELPADPKADRIFESPRVFLSMQSYLKLSLKYAKDVSTGRLRVLNDAPGARRDPSVRPDLGTYQDTSKWWFLPTGRFFARFVNYGATLDPEHPGLTEGWGRYAIDEDDRVKVETDKGESIALEFIDGRRNLLWGARMFGNVVWELEALKRYQEGR